MANRSIKCYGRAFSVDGNVDVVLRINDNEVFNGSVTAVAQTAPGKSILAPEALCTFNVDSTLDGDVAVSVAVSGGSLFFTGFGTDELFGSEGSQLKTGISINGGSAFELDTSTLADSETGEMFLTVDDGSAATFTYNLKGVIPA